MNAMSVGAAATTPGPGATTPGPGATIPGRAATTPGPAASSHDPKARLRWAANELQALFLQQLFQAMRDSVPEGDPSTDASGEEIFTSMLDEHVASLSAQREMNGLGEALYHQLARRLPAEESR